MALEICDQILPLFIPGTLGSQEPSWCGVVRVHPFGHVTTAPGTGEDDLPFLWRLILELTQKIDDTFGPIRIEIGQMTVEMKRDIFVVGDQYDARRDG